MINGMVLDENREKMSKSKGNIVSPDEVLEKFPVDAARYWAAGTRIGDDFPFKEKDLVAGEKLMRKLWNASKLVQDLVTADSISISEDEFDPIDRWMLAELDRTIENATLQMDNYGFSKARDGIRESFWNTFCDNYLEIAKQRESSESMQYVLQHAHQAYLKMFAPFLSHVTEELWNEMYSGESIHLQDWPEMSGVEADMEAGKTAMEVIGALRKYKTENQLAPTAELDHVQVYGRIEGFEDEISEVMHVRELETLEEKPEIDSKIVEIKLDYEKAGPEYGDRISGIEEALENSEWNIADGHLDVADTKLDPEMFEVVEERDYQGQGEMLETENALVIVG